MNKRILVLYIGGTIGMKKNINNAYVPAPKNTFSKEIKNSEELHNYNLAQKLQLKTDEFVFLIEEKNEIIIYKIEEYSPLLDSSNMSVKEWIKIAKDIEKNYEKFNGFIILQGTDTLTYTSSILSYIFENLQKPIIVSGSQIPIFEAKSDAKNNFKFALIFASGIYHQIPEVCVFFANKLFRGNRTKKIASNLFDAFESPNYHHLAEIFRDELKIFPHFIRQTAKMNNHLIVNTNLNEHIGVLTIYPTITAKQLEFFLKPPIKGLVLLTYGMGNIPSNRLDLLKMLKIALTNEVIILNITQCFKGTVKHCYESGKILESMGVISGSDMTTEAAYTKLIWILGQPNFNYQQKIELLKTNLRGELSDDRKSFIN